MPSVSSQPLRVLTWRMLIAGALLCAGDARGAVVPFTWTGPALGLWSDPANWSPALLPDENAAPTDTYTVRIDDDADVNTTIVLDVATRISSLRIDPGDTLSVPSFTSVNLPRSFGSFDNAGTFSISRNVTFRAGAGNLFSNSGSIQLLATSSAGVNLSLNNPLTLAGGGDLLLRSTSAGEATLRSTFPIRVPLINQDNTIRGNGILGNMPTGDSGILLSLTNRGIIRAEEIDGRSNLTISTEQGIRNEYLIEAPAGTSITLPASIPQVLTQSARGRIQIDGTLNTAPLSISGGIIAGAGAIDFLSDPEHPRALTMLDDVTVSPGSSANPFAALAVRGDMNLNSATYRADLDDDSAASDRLVVLSLLNLSSPADTLFLAGGELDRTYAVVSYGSRSGTFDTIAGDNPLFIYTPAYDDNAKQIRVTITPETTLAVVLIPALVCLIRRRR